MSNKPKIALMTYAIDGRLAKGTAVVARKSVEALLNSRDQFDLTFIHYERSDDPIYRHGVREVIFPESRLRFLNRRFLRQVYYFLTTEDTFDIVHWFQPRLYPFFWLAPTKHIVTTLHGAGDLTKDKHFYVSRWVFNWVLRLCNRKVSAAIAGSDYAKRDIVKKYGFNPEHVHVINNGVGESFFPRSIEEISTVRNTYNLPDFFFLNVARLEPTKNALRTMRAFELFAQSLVENNIHFVNIGSKGAERPLVDAFLQNSPYKNRIHLINYVEEKDLPVVYSAAYALVFPLLNEGFGLPLIEAMACGTPVVASKTAYPEIRDDEALLVDALSEEEIADAMRRIAEDPELRAGLIEKGFECARKLSWQETGNKVISLYKELLVMI